jgi:hypothetical protein
VPTAGQTVSIRNQIDLDGLPVDGRLTEASLELSSLEFINM